jgi:radical SAM protein with 4Fe4S-binding SPASM domain
VENGFPVNLRTVVDLENIRDLVTMAEFLDSKGWLDLPPEKFKTQLGRNYELFECYFKPQHLMTQAELWAEYSALSKEYPILEKFHRPDFKGIRHMVDTGELYMASFDTCPAAKTEWVFDLHGEIYGCTASCGRREYLLGTFWPEVTLDAAAVEKWQMRNVRSIDKCKSCKYDVICGGGCGVVAANANGGDPLTPDCRPIGELLETGVNHYIGDIRRMTDALEETHAAEAIYADDCCCAPAPEQDDCCCAPAHKTEGCVVCGSELIYSDASHTDTCLVCGKEFATNISCPNGHYICDSCHGADILGQVKRLLAASTTADPAALLQEVFGLPGLKMHGPEYHSIVPAVLVAAYQNKAGCRDEAMLDEAIRRGRDVKGGSCGYHGVCGAAAGTGIAASVLEQATPLSDGARSSAMAVTGRALLDLSRHGGPRCCKRDSASAVESFIAHTDYFGDLKPAEYVCSQFAANKDCIGVRCPYFPANTTHQ